MGQPKLELEEVSTVRVRGFGQPAHDQDRRDLARMGKEEILKRQFGFMSMLGFGCIVLSTWEGVLVLFAQGFTNGGPAGLVYGFILTWIGTMSIFVTLSELASIFPTSAGQYYWCALLAPSKFKRIASYVTGWLTVCAWQAAVASASYLSGTIVQGLIILYNPSYNPAAWQAMLLMWASLLIAVLLNTAVSNFLPKVEGAVLIFHVLGFFGILIPVAYLSQGHNSASEVFTTFINNGGWPTTGVSFWVGISATVFLFLGADSIIHMSEEIHSASRTVPQAIVGGIAINGLLGFGMLLGTLFTLSDPDTILETAYMYPFIQIFLDSTQSKAGTAAMTAVILALTIFSTIGLLASSSRMTWSFARDRGLPGWRYLSRVNSRTSIPVTAIVVTTVIAVLLDLINLGSSTVLNDIISLAVNSFYGSYFISAALLLYRRCTGGIRDPEAALDSDTGSSTTLTWGPWRVKGVVGVINNIYACGWMILVLIFTAWPAATPVTAESMNYSIFITIFVALVSGVYYVVWGHKTYKGPVVEIDESPSP